MMTGDAEMTSCCGDEASGIEFMMVGDDVTSSIVGSVVTSTTVWFYKHTTTG